MTIREGWGRTLAGDPAGDTLIGALDRAVDRVKRAAESGDEAAIGDVLPEMQRLAWKYEATMKNRLNDGRGRSRRATLEYLERCHSFVEAASIAYAALAGPEAAKKSASLKENAEILAAQVEIARGQT
jgi:hypothetical protein